MLSTNCNCNFAEENTCHNIPSFFIGSDFGHCGLLDKGIRPFWDTSHFSLILVSEHPSSNRYMTFIIRGDRDLSSCMFFLLVFLVPRLSPFWSLSLCTLLMFQYKKQLFRQNKCVCVGHTFSSSCLCCIGLIKIPLHCFLIGSRFSHTLNGIPNIHQLSPPKEYVLECCFWQSSCMPRAS